MAIRRTKVVVLASGGIDSTACIRFYKKLKFDVEALHIDYGQLSRKRENIAVQNVAEYFQIKLQILRVKSIQNFLGGLIQGRNAFLYFSALMNFPGKSGLIASGIHSGTTYYDCSLQFIKDMQSVFNGYSRGTIKAEAPFLNFTKKEIVSYCQIEKITLDNTYSCELGKTQPCGICNTCKDLEKIYDGSK